MSITLARDETVAGPRGFDAGKKITGRKRHVAVDTLGLPMECHAAAASVQDRDALAPLLSLRSRMLAKTRGQRRREDAFTCAGLTFAVEPRFAHRLHRDNRESGESTASNAHAVKSPD